MHVTGEFRTYSRCMNRRRYERVCPHIRRRCDVWPRGARTCTLSSWAKSPECLLSSRRRRIFCLHIYGHCTMIPHLLSSDSNAEVRFRLVSSYSRCGCGLFIPHSHTLFIHPSASTLCTSLSLLAQKQRNLLYEIKYNFLKSY